MRFHDIRHSAASILYDAGWELKDIQEWLGHSDIEKTGNIYTHISKIRKEKKGMELAGTFRLLKKRPFHANGTVSKGDILLIFAFFVLIMPCSLENPLDGR